MRFSKMKVEKHYTVVKSTKTTDNYKILQNSEKAFSAFDQTYNDAKKFELSLFGILKPARYGMQMTVRLLEQEEISQSNPANIVKRFKFKTFPGAFSFIRE